MSLFFGAATSDKVDCGSAAILDNLPSGANGFTVLSIVRRTQNAANLSIVGKDGVYPTNGWLFTSDGTTNGDLRLLVFRSSTITDYMSSTVCLPLNEWAFGAAAFKESDATRASIYYGTLGGAVAEAAYTTSQNGAGTIGDDSTYNLYLGNIQRTGAHPFKGDEGIIAIVNRRLSLAECEDWKNNPRMIDGTIMFHRPGENGNVTQIDLSGNGNNGTVTGATLSADPPLIRADKRRLTLVPYALGGATAALTGTITTANEGDIVTGGKAIILTLTGDTWVTAGATFDAQRQNIINGLDSAQAEAAGWDAVVKVNEVVGSVVRTSDTVVTITLSAHATYDITATETITATIPATALTLAGAVVASPTFTVTATTAGGWLQRGYWWSQTYGNLAR